MISIYAGLNGKGKTASATLAAVKKYKRDNSLINRILFVREFKMKWYKIFDRDLTAIVKVYSNYPILLKKGGRLHAFGKRSDVYSHMVSIHHLRMNYSFPKKALIILDEAQNYYDSREFKVFPREIGTFFQHHRHHDVEDIILITQNPKRLDNKLRDLAGVFRKYRIWLTLPFIPFGFYYYTDYYEPDEFGMYHHMKREMKNFESNNHFRFFLKRNVYPRYNSKYYHVIFDKLPKIMTSRFTQKDMTDYEIKNIDNA